jgi:protein-disulfide isomerase
MPDNNKDVTSLAVAIILVATLLNTFMVFRLTRKVDALGRPAVAAAQPAAPAVPARTVDVSLDDDAVKGDANAPVVIVEFTDYECPFCGRHFVQTHARLVEQYIETGKVKLIVRDYPLSFHPHAQKAAEAAECAGEQGDDHYWAMHDQLFANQASLGVDNYKRWAGELGLDQAAFDQCLDSGAMADEVANDLVDGTAYGVTGTPIFFINGRMVSGAQPFAVFEAVIEKALED